MSLGRNPVVLVHGIDDSAACLKKLSAYLTSRGWQVSSFDLIPSNGALGIPELAMQLEKHIAENYSTDTSLDFVAFSLGGIVSRYYLQRMGGNARARRFVTISCPHHGSLIGFLRWNIGGRHLRVGSALLRDLNSDIDMLSQLKCTSIWTPFDIVIVPASSSHLPFGEEVVIPVLIHAWMLRDERSLAAVAKGLG